MEIGHRNFSTRRAHATAANGSCMLAITMINRHRNDFQFAPESRRCHAESVRAYTKDAYIH